MKHLLLTLMLSASLHLTAQVSFYPDFGNAVAEELAMKTCDFDKEAVAVYLKKDAKIFPDDFKMVSIHRVRLKILKESSKSYADIRIPYYHVNDFEYITDIQGVVINNDNGTYTKSYLTPKDIHRKKVSNTHSYVIFTFPEVHPGSIIEYTYTSIQKSYSAVDYWYFQDEIPVMSSHFHFTVLPTAEFNYRVLKSEQLYCDVKTDNVNGSITFEMKKIPALADEQFMDARRDYLQRVELQLAFHNSAGYRDVFVSNWKDAVKELSEDEEFGKAISKPFSGADDVLKPAVLIADPYEKMRFIYGAVKSRMKCDSYNHTRATEKLKKIWETKSGSNADINLILVSLLKAAGLEVSPMLASDRDHGRVDVSQAYLGQFNKVIAFVTLNNRNFFLDATDDFDNTKLVPETLLNTNGFLVDKKNAAFVTIGDDKHMEKKTVSVTAKLESDGVLQGSASVLEYDYRRASSKYRINKDKNAFIRDFYIDPYHGISIDSFDVQNMQNDTLPLNQKINYRLLLKPSGDYLLLSLNLFNGMEKNPFIADQRYTNINFGSKRVLTLFQNFELGPQLSVEALPKNVTLLMPDKSIRYQRTLELSPDGKRVTAFIKIEMLESMYEAGRYPTVKEFFKQMYAMIDEPVLIKKQNNLSKTP